MSVGKLKKYFIQNRFSFLFFALNYLVFHPLFFPVSFTRYYALPFGIILVFIAGYFLFLQAKRWQQNLLMTYNVFLFCLVLFFTFVIPFPDIESEWLAAAINMVYLSYFIIIFYQLMREMFRDDDFDLDMIYASLSGFIILNIVTTFLFMLTEFIHPNSFRGVDEQAINIFDEFLYASFITLTSIGYGDIVPQSAGAKKVVMLMGTLGQFYIIVIVSLVVGKYAARTPKQ